MHPNNNKREIFMKLDYKIIGNRIKTRRRLKNVTQEKMAEDLELSVGFVSQLERGVSKVSLDTLSCIASYLDCPISAILENTDYNNSNYCQTELNSMYESLSWSEQKLFYSIMECFINNK